LNYENRNTYQLCGFVNFIILLMIIYAVLLALSKLSCWNTNANAWLDEMNLLKVLEEERIAEETNVTFQKKQDYRDWKKTGNPNKSFSIFM